MQPTNDIDIDMSPTAIAMRSPSSPPAIRQRKQDLVRASQDLNQSASFRSESDAHEPSPHPTKQAARLEPPSLVFRSKPSQDVEAMEQTAPGTSLERRYHFELTYRAKPHGAERTDLTTGQDEPHPRELPKNPQESPYIRDTPARMQQEKELIPRIHQHGVSCRVSKSSTKNKTPVFEVSHEWKCAYIAASTQARILATQLKADDAHRLADGEDAAEGWPSTKKKHLEAKQVEAIEAIRKLASRGIAERMWSAKKKLQDSKEDLEEAKEELCDAREELSKATREVQDAKVLLRDAEQEIRAAKEARKHASRACEALHTSKGSRNSGTEYLGNK